MDPRLLLSTLGEVCCAVPAEIAERTGVDEPHVAAALESLAVAGFVSRDDRGGYELPPRTEDEARELYVVAILLEGLAIRSAPRFDDDALARLRAVNDRLLGDAGDDDASQTDDEFHRLLVAGCGNDQLIEQHAAAKAALLRYERSYFHEPELRRRSHGEHEAIVAALAAGDHARAAVAVRRNFESSLPDLTRGLDSGRSRVDASRRG